MIRKPFYRVFQTAAYQTFVWKLAKFGWRLIRLYAKAQHSIDGDFVQVREIVGEWLDELKA